MRLGGVFNKFSAPGRSRTSNLRLRRPSLYPLSHRRVVRYLLYTIHYNFTIDYLKKSEELLAIIKN